ncbi:MAG: hypothetical protein ACI8PZ_007392 [Myxococcota bacterium]
MFACQGREGWGLANLDCDDTRPDINPGMPEICNPDAPVDDDCDGLIDDADPDVTEDSYLEWYADRDADGFGADDDFVYACSRPDGTAASNDDCDDADPTVGPPSLWYADGDRDGFGAGAPVDPTPTCDPPGPGLAPDWIGLDCDDGQPTVHPDAEEVCEDGIDQDCDGDDPPCSGVGLVLTRGGSETVGLVGIDGTGTLLVRCNAWDGGTCTDVQVDLGGDGCVSYADLGVWHGTTYYNAPEARICPILCQATTGAADDTYSVCAAGGASYTSPGGWIATGYADASGPACAPDNAYWRESVVFPRGNYNLRFGTYGVGQPALRLSCNGWR